jgi:hypothetical protein
MSDRVGVSTDWFVVTGWMYDKCVTKWGSLYVSDTERLSERVHDPVSGSSGLVTE